MAGVVVDASVAAKWFLQEDRTEEALALLRSGQPLIAPDTVVLEVFNSIWAAARKQRLTMTQVAEIEPHIPAPFSELVAASALFGRAAELARTLVYQIYDTLFLALAERERCPLVTADERLYAAGRKVRISAQLL